MVIVRRSTYEMADRTVRDFPLFPLALVALPHELVALHIFEERYRIMFEELLRNHGEFGIVLAHRVGHEGHRLRVRDRRGPRAHEDGRLNVLTRGTRPFRIVERQDDMPYPAATVEFLDDKDEPVDERAAERPGRRTPSSSSRRPTTSPTPTTSR